MHNRFRFIIIMVAFIDWHLIFMQHESLIGNHNNRVTFNYLVSSLILIYYRINTWNTQFTETL